MLTFFRFILSYKHEFHVNSRGIPLQDDNNYFIIIVIIIINFIIIII